MATPLFSNFYFLNKNDKKLQSSFYIVPMQSYKRINNISSQFRFNRGFQYSLTFIHILFYLFLVFSQTHTTKKSIYK